jgi:predicted secreted protein
MKPISWAAIYLLFWVVVLFAMLPIGVRTSDEAGERRVEGQAESAPSNPMLGRKLLWTTLVSAVLFGLFWANYQFGWIEVEDLPGGRPVQAD